MEAVRENRDELQKLIQDRQRLEKEILEVTEQERIRIGQDLHDNLGQQLTGIALLTKNLEQKLAEKHYPEAAGINKIQALLNQAIQYTRDLSRWLTSVKSDQEDLPAALQRLAGQVSALSNISCRCQSQGEMPSLEPSITRQLFHIAQEAVANAIKHGQPRRVFLHWFGLPDKLVLRIRNDGRPFPAELPPHSGLGLRIMAYRAEVIGATLSVRPNRKHGAVVVCTLPTRQKFLPGLTAPWR